MRRFCLALVSFGLAVPARAAEGGEATTFLGLPRWLWYSANLLAFFGLLVYLLAKPLSRFFHTRRTEIARALAEAARQREEAARLQAETEGRVASLESQIAALRVRLRREGEREREALERQGEQEAARFLAQMEQEAVRRVEEARTALAREAAEVAAELARELLEKEITPADRERIFRTTLERLRSEGRGGGR